MKPLLYLFSRSVVNGVRRALTSPFRLLGILFFILYNLWWIPRIALGGFSGDGLAGQFTRLPFPPIDVVELLVFVLFCFATALLSFNLFSHKGDFRSSDVDVLFPTPISPKIVLVFRLLRDSALTIFIPLLLLIIFWRPASGVWTTIFEDVPNPSTAPQTLRFGALAYFLLALNSVVGSYAINLTLQRPTQEMDRVRRVVYLLVALIVTGFLTWFVLSLSRVGSFAEASDVIRSWQVQTAMFPALAATALTVAPLSGDWVGFAIGTGTLVCMLAIAFTAAFRQTGWVYEMAALRSGVREKARSMARSGDMYGMAAERARSGKLRTGRWRFLAQFNASGTRAVIWKEAIVTIRTGLLGYVILILLGIVAAMVAALLYRAEGVRSIGWLYLFLHSIMLFGPSAGFGQAGFVDFVRRIDLVKPLPFSRIRLLWAEVLGKSMMALLSVVSGVLTLCIAAPALWPFALAGVIMLPVLAVAYSALFLLLVILMPDIEDPTQRGFRGLATMVGMFTLTIPPALIFVALAYLQIPPPVAALPAAAILAGITVLSVLASAKAFENFNPAD